MDHGLWTCTVRKIFITGSNGLLGQKIVRKLADRADFQILAVSKGPNRLFSLPNLPYESLDLTDLAATQKLLEKFRPDTVLHTAAMTNVDQCEKKKEACWEINVEAVENLAQICEKHQIHLIHLSTDFIFDGAAGPYKEEDQPNPLSYYGQSKLASEKIVQKNKFPWAILRTILLYGVTEDQGRSNAV